MYQLTQRPDKTASGLMEGRVAVIVDNSPMAMLLPVTANVFFQASDDYYNRWETATFARILRYLSAFLAVGAAGILRGDRRISSGNPADSVSAGAGVCQGRSAFSGSGGSYIMELAFELLREAGIRLPGQLGEPSEW